MHPVTRWRSRSRSASGSATEPRHEGAQDWPTARRDDESSPPAGAGGAAAGETGPATAQIARRAISTADSMPSSAHLNGRPPQSLVLGRPPATSEARHLPPTPDGSTSRPAKAAVATDCGASSARPQGACPTGQSAGVHTERPSGDALEAPSKGPLANAAKGSPSITDVSSDQSPPRTTGRQHVGSAAAPRSVPRRTTRSAAQASAPHPVAWHPAGEAVSAAVPARAGRTPSLPPAVRPHPGSTSRVPGHDEEAEPPPGTAHRTPAVPPPLRQGSCDAIPGVTGAGDVAVPRTSPVAGSADRRMTVEQSAGRRQVVVPPAVPPQQTAPEPPFRTPPPLGTRASDVASREAKGSARKERSGRVPDKSSGSVAGSRNGQAQAVRAAQQELAQLLSTRRSDRAGTGQTLADMAWSARRSQSFPCEPAGSLAGTPLSGSASGGRPEWAQRPQPSGLTPSPPVSRAPAQAVPTAPHRIMPGAAAVVLNTEPVPGPSPRVMAAARSDRGVASPAGSSTPDGHPCRAADGNRAGQLATAPPALAPARGPRTATAHAHTASRFENPRTAGIPTERPAVAATATRAVRARFVPVTASPGERLALSPTQQRPGNPSVPSTARMMAGSATVPAGLRTGGNAHWGIPSGRSAQERR